MTALADHEMPPEAQPHDRPSVPGRLRDRLREQTQAAILDAAERIITEEGTALARIDAIAATAGVSVGTLYNHFVDRDTLVTAVIHDRRRTLLTRLRALVDSPDGDFATKLLAFFDDFAMAGTRHGRFFAVVMGEHGGLKSWQCERDETVAEWLTLSEQLVLQGVREGVVAEGREANLSIILKSLARIAVLGPVQQRSPIDSAELVHFFLHGASSRSHNVPAGDGSPL